MELLGKELSEYCECPNWDVHTQLTWFTNIARNKDVFRRRYDEGKYEECVWPLIKNGNEILPTREIINNVYAIIYLNIFNNDELVILLPFIEQALQFNVDYLKCLYDIEPFFKKIYEKYGRHGTFTLNKRMSLEFWQGLFNFEYHEQYRKVFYKTI